MYKSSGSQFFKIRIRHLCQIKDRCDFFNQLGIPEVLCSIRFVLEVEGGNEISESSRSELNIFYTSEAFVPRCPVEKVFLEISQNSHENTCARVSFLIKVKS